MTDLASSKEALLTEHFRYTPLSLIDDIINTVNAIIYQALTGLEAGLLRQPPETLGFSTSSHPSSANVLALTDTDGDGNVEYPEEARTELENGVHQIETLMEATVDKNFDKLEIYMLRNLLTVPEDVLPWVRLRHYENIPLPIPPGAPTPFSISTLRDSLRSTRKLTLALETERAKNAATLSQLRAILGVQRPQKTEPATSAKIEDQTSSVPVKTEDAPLSFLTHAKTSNLPPSAQFTASHIPTMLSLLSELRPKSSTLPAQLSKGMDRNGSREARREYIESVVGRVVRRSGVEEGEGSGGRKVGAEEVGALEGWVEGMDGGKGVEGREKRDWEGDVGMGVD